MFSWKKKEVDSVNVREDLDAVISFLKELNVSDLIKKIELMRNLAREEEIIHSPLKKDNLIKQITTLDQIFLAYGSLENDVDINGVRLRKIASELLRKAKEEQLS